MLLFIAIDASRLPKRWKDIRDNTNKKRQGVIKRDVAENLMFLVPFLKGKDKTLEKYLLSQDSQKHGSQDASNFQEYADDISVRSDTIPYENDAQGDFTTASSTVCHDPLPPNQPLLPNQPPLPAWIGRVKSQQHLERNLLLKKKLILQRLKRRLTKSLLNLIMILTLNSVEHERCLKT